MAHRWWSQLSRNTNGRSSLRRLIGACGLFLLQICTCAQTIYTLTRMTSKKLATLMSCLRTSLSALFAFQIWGSRSPATCTVSVLQRTRRLRKSGRSFLCLKSALTRTSLSLTRAQSIPTWKIWSLWDGSTPHQRRLTSCRHLQLYSILSFWSTTPVGTPRRLSLLHAALLPAPAHSVYTSWHPKVSNGASSTKRLQYNQTSQTTMVKTFTRRCKWFCQTNSLASSWYLREVSGTTTSTGRTSQWTCGTTWC